MADKEVNLTLKVDAEQAVKATKEQTTQMTKLEKAQKSYIDTLSEEGKEIRSVNKSKAQLKKQQDLETQAANSAAGSYDQLSAQYRLNVIQLNQVNTTVGEATDETLELVNQTADLKTAMNDAKKATNDFTQQVGDYRDEAKGATTQTNSFSKIGRKAFKAVGTVGKGALKGIGLAFKAMGIGLIVAGFAALFEALKKNQKVMDAFQTVTNAIGIVLRPVIDGVGDLIEGISNGSKEFDAIGKVIKGLINLALIPLKISFNQIKLGIQFIVLGWLEVKKALGGDVDNGRIEKLNEDIEKTKESTKALVAEAKGSVKLIVNNVGEAIGEISDLGSKVSEGISQAVEDVKNGAAIAATEAAKALELLNLEQQKQMLEFQRRAEIFRQIRDDESISIDERIQANKDLGAVLLEQANVERKVLADKKEAQEAINKVDGDTLEGQKKLLEIRNEAIDLEERITGQQSEQLVNINSLNKEKLEQEKAFLVAKEELINDLALEATENEEERELLKAEQDAEKKGLELENMILEAEERTELEALLLEQKENTLADIREKFGEKKLAEQKKLDDEELKSKEKSQKGIARSLSIGLNALKAVFGESKALQIASIITEKATAIASIITSTQKSNARNILQATAAAPPPANLPIIGLAKTQNVVNSIGAGLNIATIAATTKFQRGGFLNGPTHAGGGIDLGFGREAEGGEFLSSVATMSNPKLSGIVQAVNDAGNNNQDISIGVTEERVAEIAAQIIGDVKIVVPVDVVTEVQKETDVRESEFNG